MLLLLLAAAAVIVVNAQCPCTTDLSRSCCTDANSNPVLAGNDDWYVTTNGATGTTYCSSVSVYAGYDPGPSLQYWILKRFALSAVVGSNMTLSGTIMQLYNSGADAAMVLYFDVEDSSTTQDCSGTSAWLRTFRPLFVSDNFTDHGGIYNNSPDISAIINDFTDAYPCAEYITIRVRAGNYLSVAGTLNGWALESGQTSGGVSYSRLWWGDGTCTFPDCTSHSTVSQGYSGSTNIQRYQVSNGALFTGFQQGLTGGNYYRSALRMPISLLPSETIRSLTITGTAVNLHNISGALYVVDIEDSVSAAELSGANTLAMRTYMGSPVTWNSAILTAVGETRTTPDLASLVHALRDAHLARDSFTVLFMVKTYENGTFPEDFQNFGTSFQLDLQKDCTLIYTCGDELLTSGEECDDGNTVGGDGCNATCFSEICGNGVVDVGEECDDNNTVSGDGCNATCFSEYCGDGIVNNANEECDDANANNTDVCGNDCLWTYCACPAENSQTVSSVWTEEIFNSARVADRCADSTGSISRNSLGTQILSTNFLFDARSLVCNDTEEIYLAMFAWSTPTYGLRGEYGVFTISVEADYEPLGCQGSLPVVERSYYATTVAWNVSRMRYAVSPDLGPMLRGLLAANPTRCVQNLLLHVDPAATQSSFAPRKDAGYEAALLVGPQTTSVPSCPCTGAPASTETTAMRFAYEATYEAGGFAPYIQSTLVEANDELYIDAWDYGSNDNYQSLVAMRFDVAAVAQTYARFGDVRLRLVDTRTAGWTLFGPAYMYLEISLEDTVDAPDERTGEYNTYRAYEPIVVQWAIPISPVPETDPLISPNLAAMFNDLFERSGDACPQHITVRMRTYSPYEANATVPYENDFQFAVGLNASTTPRLIFSGPECSGSCCGSCANGALYCADAVNFTEGCDTYTDAYEASTSTTCTGTFTANTTCASDCSQGFMCGNSLVDPGEACDDGNTVGGDGCSPTCTTETACPCDEPTTGTTVLIASANDDWSSATTNGVTGTNGCGNSPNSERNGDTNQTTQMGFRFDVSTLFGSDMLLNDVRLILTRIFGGGSTHYIAIEDTMYPQDCTDAASVARVYLPETVTWAAPSTGSVVSSPNIASLFTALFQKYPGVCPAYVGLTVRPPNLASGWVGWFMVSSGTAILSANDTACIGSCCGDCIGDDFCADSVDGNTACQAVLSAESCTRTFTAAGTCANNCSSYITCGNGLLETGEDCDDGSGNDGYSGCDPSCQTAGTTGCGCATPTSAYADGGPTITPYETWQEDIVNGVSTVTANPTTHYAGYTSSTNTSRHFFFRLDISAWLKSEGTCTLFWTYMSRADGTQYATNIMLYIQNTIFPEGPTGDLMADRNWTSGMAWYTRSYMSGWYARTPDISYLVNEMMDADTRHREYCPRWVVMRVSPAYDGYDNVYVVDTLKKIYDVNSQCVAPCDCSEPGQFGIGSAAIGDQFALYQFGNPPSSWSSWNDNPSVTWNSAATELGWGFIQLPLTSSLYSTSYVNSAILRLRARDCSPNCTVTVRVRVENTYYPLKHTGTTINQRVLLPDYVDAEFTPSATGVSGNLTANLAPLFNALLAAHPDKCPATISLVLTPSPLDPTYGDPGWVTFYSNSWGGANIPWLYLETSCPGSCCGNCSTSDSFCINNTDGNTACQGFFASQTCDRTFTPGGTCDGDCPGHVACGTETPSCTLYECGDGELNGGEACDDGNANETDACLNNCTLTYCGDGAVNRDEQCDDGNTVSGDGCSATCVTEYCGDGIVNNNGEECDDGNADNTDACPSTCLNAVCGDGYVWAGVEECDETNDDFSDACPPTCFNATCGDGYVWTGVEECDDGNANDTDACANNCTLTYCGDGVRNRDEHCDDGNLIDDDDCANNCTRTHCGDGFVNTDEECDDGNTNDTDACSNDCIITFCGDGIVNRDEECDDGNANNTDACTNNCTLTFCGDGIVNRDEECDDHNTDNTDACANDCTWTTLCHRTGRAELPCCLPNSECVYADCGICSGLGGTSHNAPSCTLSPCFTPVSSSSSSSTSSTTTTTTTTGSAAPAAGTSLPAGIIAVIVTAAVVVAVVTVVAGIVARSRSSSSSSTSRFQPRRILRRRTR